MGVKFTNNAYTTLSGTISAGATSFGVASVATFPSLGGGDYMYVSLTDEVVKVTAISGTTCTCVAVSGGHSAGISVELRMTAELLNDFAEDDESLQLAGGAMTGNITMAGSQTVDGRDLSVDGAKLDGIEASATADQTAAQIKTLLEDGIDSVHYVDGSIDAVHMSANSIDSASYVDGSIDTAHFAAGAVDAAAMGANSVDSSELVDGSVDLSHMSVNSVDSDQYVDGSIDLIHMSADSVDGSKIVDDAINSEHIAADSIDAEHYAAGSVDTTALGADSVTTAKIADNVALGGSPTTTTQAESDDSTKIATTAYVVDKITTLIGGAPSTLNDLNELAAAINDDASYNSTLTTALGTKLPKAGGAMTGAITTNSTFDGRDVATDGTKLDGIEASATADQTAAQIKTHLENGINSVHYVDGSIDAIHLANDSVTEAKVAANSIDSQAYVNGSIDREHLAADIIDGTKIANDVINSEHYAAGSIDNEHIADNAVNSEHYADGSIDTAHLGALQVTGAKMANDRRSTSTGQDIHSGNAHDYTFYDASAGIRWYTTGSEEMRLEDDGDLHVDGDVIAFSTTVSDERLKHDIEPITDALSKVGQLNGVTFTYNKDDKKSAGLIAQDVEKVLPSAVSEKELPLKHDDGIAYKTVQYDQTIGLLVEAIKELTAKVEKLENK